MNYIQFCPRMAVLGYFKLGYFDYLVKFIPLKGLSHEIDFKNFDQNLKNLALLRDATGV
jgi:hypothetical protein